MNVGDRVRVKRDFVSVPEGTEGIIVDDYGTGIMVAWDKPERPYPKDLSPQEVARMAGVNPKCPLRDGFDKELELKWLEVVG